MSLAKNNSALGAHYHRIKVKHDVATAVVSTAAKIARIMYVIVTKQVEYKDVGSDYYEKKYLKKAIKNLKYKASKLGLQFVLKEGTE